MRFLCPQWKLGFGKAGFKDGLKRYAIPGVGVALAGFAAFLIGALPFDKHPSAAKVVFEGVVYYVGVALVEELYVRGLLLQWIEKLFEKSRRRAWIAVLLSSLIFAMGHLFGALGQPLPTAAAKFVWTAGMGLFFGTVYKTTGNLWVPTIFHFLVNVCALPYLFSSKGGYAPVTLAILVPVYLALGIYSAFLWKNREKCCGET